MQINRNLYIVLFFKKHVFFVCACVIILLVVGMRWHRIPSTKEKGTALYLFAIKGFPNSLITHKFISVRLILDVQWHSRYKHTCILCLNTFCDFVLFLHCVKKYQQVIIFIYIFLFD